MKTLDEEIKEHNLALFFEILKAEKNENENEKD